MIKTLICLFFIVFSTVSAQYYSQCRQDQFVHEHFFKNRRDGVFLEIGAHNGISFSNTYFFEKELGWTGLCLEPIPQIFEQLIKNRRCRCIQGCAGVDHQVIKQFLKISGPIEMLSGLVDKFDEAHRRRIDRELKLYGGSYEVIDVPCYNLNILLEEVGIHHINFLSIDTEGGEYEILENFDFVKCPVDVITVEDNYRIHPFKSLLKSRGFRLAAKLDQDLVFVNFNSSKVQF